MIPLNDTRRVFEAKRDALASNLLDVASSGRYLFGPHSERFALAFADYCQARFCLPVGNGTDALELALRAGLQPGFTDRPEVITVANAGGYTTTACRVIGAVPVYVDIDPSTLLLDVNAIEAALGPNTQAIVLTHLYGAAVDVLAVRNILARAGYEHVTIIEDCAQAHGAALPDGRRVGGLGDIATFSFYPTKNLPAMGDAGAILTSSPDRYDALKQLHQYGWSQKYVVARAGGRNSRLDEVQAAVLSTLLPELDGMNIRRKEVLAQYEAVSVPGVVWCEHHFGGNVAHLAVCQVERRDQFRRFMADLGIATEIHYPILDCDQTAWREMPMRIVGSLPASRMATTRIVSLPCFPFLTKDEIDHVCRALIEWSNHVDRSD